MFLQIIIYQKRDDLLVSSPRVVEQGKQAYISGSTLLPLFDKLFQRVK